MSRTGYSAVRAIPHEEWASDVVAELRRRGYTAWPLAPDGDGPDIAFRQPVGELAFIDVKCPTGVNYAIKTGAIQLALARRETTFFFSRSDARVHTVVTLLPRLILGPCRPTGNGSLTDWYLFAAGGGTPFSEFFPERDTATRKVTP